jgi:Ca2+-binding EF-hand superfamily protein
MKTTIIFASVAAIAAAGVALAQPGAQNPDPNADVTREQVIERTDQHFRQMDANNDGRFTTEEAQQMREQHRTEMRQRAFDRLDGNRDGNISREEFASAHADRAERRGERGMRGGRRGGHGMAMHHGRGRGEGMGMGRGMRGMRGMFGEQGFVTREQFRERALARFDRLDADRNGTVTAAERREAHERMGRGMPERREPTQ